MKVMIFLCTFLALPMSSLSSNIQRQKLSSSKKSHDIKVILTAALIDTKYSMRKKEYTYAIKSLASYGITNPYIIEAIKKEGPTFLDHYSRNVFYSTMNDACLYNKGVNEARTMLEGLRYFNFNSDDMILKLTGRYYFANDSFINTIKNNPDYDGFIKIETTPHMQAQISSYALRNDLLQEMLESFDYDYMEKDMISLEYVIFHYIEKLISDGRAKIMFVPQLHIWANSFGIGEPEMLYL